jgi:hypothetical protein
MKDTTNRDQFMRIAMARLKQHYPFYPQRLANAARLYRRHLENLEK